MKSKIAKIGKEKKNIKNNLTQIKENKYFMQNFTIVDSDLLQFHSQIHMFTS